MFDTTKNIESKHNKSFKNFQIAYSLKQVYGLSPSLFA